MRKFVLSLLLAVVAPAAFAAYPERPITMIIAYSPGGGTDLVARALAPYLEKYLGGGAKIVIVNRAGAGGEVGFAALANSPADGYTIGFVNTPPLMTIPIERKAQFQALGFDFIGNIVDDPSNFAVHTESDIRTLNDLAAFARANPGKATVGTTGIGSDDHLAMLIFERIAGVNDDARAVQGLGRRAHRARLSSDHGGRNQRRRGAAGDPWRAAAARTSASSRPARSMLAPDLPTGKEQGFDFVAFLAARHGGSQGPARQTCASAW